jgi:hypothetical protein
MDTDQKEYTCGRCGAKAQSKVSASGKVHYPRSWKPFNGVLTCDKCRKQNYRRITLSWRVRGCVSSHNVPDNAIVVEVQTENGQSYIRKLDLDTAPPDGSPRSSPVMTTVNH